MEDNMKMAVLGEVAEIIMGQSPEGNTYNNIGLGIPLLNGPTDFGISYPVPTVWTTAPTKLCDPDDLLFCVRGSTTGRMNWADQRYCLGRGVAGICARSGSIDTRFIYYLLLNELDRLLSLCAGSVFPNLSKSDFENFRILWPVESVRRSIVQILGILDEKNKLIHQINETLEAIVRAVFKSWFVDFDPVRAKMEGYAPYDMDAETAALFPDSFEVSTLGEIPKGWKIGLLGDVADNPRRGITPNDVNQSAPYIGLEHMPRNSIALGEWGLAQDVSSNKYRFYKGEILFGKLRPYFHKVGVAVQDGVCSTDILVIVPKFAEWYSFVLAHVSSDEFVQYTDGTSTGTKMPRTNWTDMKAYKIVLPPKSIAEQFNKIVQSMIEAIQSNIMQSQTLVSIRDALLPKLLSGKIRVKDAEKYAKALL